MKHSWFVGMTCFAVCGMMPLSATGANSNIQFNLNLTHTCSIVVTQDGILDPRPGFQRLTSRSGPGAPGRARIVATGNGFTASVSEPSSFDTQPAADTTAETFRAWHRSVGATAYTITRLPRPLSAGTSRIRVHMDARKSGSDVFEAGNYSATVILRCE